MKSMTKLMVVAMLLVAALVVAPAAARVVNPGGNVYIGEKHVDLFKVFGGEKSGTLVYYSNVATPEAATIGKTVPVTDATDFELTASDFSSIGAWYAFNTSAISDGKVKLTNQSAAAGYILVDKPSVSLDVKLAKDDEVTTDSVDGKTVTRNSKIAFEIKHNIRLATADVTKENGTVMKIEVKTPDGGTLTKLGDADLSEILLSGTKNTTKTISLKDLKPGTYTAQAKWGNTSALDSDNSNTVTFEVRSKTLTLTSSKDSVVRGNHFVVTIQGESKTNYNLFVKSPDATPAKNPMIVPNQPDVEPYVRPGGTPGTNATVKTDAGGKIDVEFNTTTSTEDKQFTIRVENTDPDKAKTDYDEVKVKVEKGSVTITASGTGTYYIGEEITLSGTCTDNDTAVHLFMTGPNLASANGVNLLTLLPVSNNPVSGESDVFNTADVKADDTWSFKWNTGDTVQNKALDAGGYTIYAVSKPVDKSGLSNAEYATASIQLRSGFITATSSGAVVAKGDDLKLTGTAQGDPESVNVWIFGKNLQIRGDPATVEDDGSFEYELKGARTKDLAAGQYFVVIQHPMMNKEFDIYDNKSDLGWIYGRDGSGFSKVKIDGLQASDAATALINALDSPNIDDTYVKLTFVVEEAQIFIDAIGDKAAGSKFTITGTTNLAVGDTLNIEVTSAAFQPTSKSEAAGFASVAGTTEVKQGDGANTWSFEVDGSSFKPDQYIVKVESIETSTTATATFNVVEAVPTTQATPTATVTGGETTPTATATTTATPTQSPGFGALVALAGLGAVAFLVLRRD